MTVVRTNDAPLAPWQRFPRRTVAVAVSVLPLVAIGNAGVLIWSLDGLELTALVVAPGLMLLAMALAFVPILTNTLRLALWSRFLGVGLGFGGGLRVVTGTTVTSAITPSASGGLPIKILFLIGEGVTARQTATLVSLQTAEDSLVLSTLVLLSLGYSGFQLVDFLGAHPGMLAHIKASVALVGWLALGLIVVLAGLSGAIASGLLGSRLKARTVRLASAGRSFGRQILHDLLGVLRRGKGVALANLSLAVVQWLARFSMAGVVLNAFGVAWQPTLFWLLQYLVQAISSLVPTPGGAGGAEAAFLLLFAPFVAVGVLVPAMSAWRLAGFYLPLVFAALVFFVMHRKALHARANAEHTSATSSQVHPVG